MYFFVEVHVWFVVCAQVGPDAGAPGQKKNSKYSDNMIPVTFPEDVKKRTPADLNVPEYDPDMQLTSVHAVSNTLFWCSDLTLLYKNGHKVVVYQASIAACHYEGSSCTFLMK